MSNHTILVIDYEPRSIDKTRRALAGAGYKVEFATDGVTGLLLFEKLRPALVLVEAMIPKKNGFEVCQEIKKTPIGQQTPVIITTSVYKGRRYRTQAIHNHRCDEYLEKPVPDEQLLGCVAKFIGEPGFSSEPPAGFTEPSHRAGGSPSSDVIELDPTIIEAIDDQPSTADRKPSPIAVASQDVGPNAFASNEEEVGLENEIVSRLDALLSITGDTATVGDIRVDAPEPPSPAADPEVEQDQAKRTAIALVEAPLPKSEPSTRIEPVDEIAPRSGKKSKKGRKGGGKHGRDRVETPEIGAASAMKPAPERASEPPPKPPVQVVQDGIAPMTTERPLERVEATTGHRSEPQGEAVRAPSELGVSEPAATVPRVSQRPEAKPGEPVTKAAKAGRVEAAPRPTHVTSPPRQRSLSLPTWVALVALAVIAVCWVMFGTGAGRTRTRPAPLPGARVALPPPVDAVPAEATVPASESPASVTADEPVRPVEDGSSLATSEPPAPAQIKKVTPAPSPQRRASPPPGSTKRTGDVATSPRTKPRPDAGATAAIPKPASPTTEASNLEPASPPPTATSTPSRVETRTPLGVAPLPSPIEEPPPARRLKAGDFVAPNELDAAPIILQRVMPSYTAKARALHQEGIVELSLVVDEMGVVRDVRVLRSIEGSDLDEAAAAAAAEWRYKPALKDGVPVKTTKIEKISFRL